MKTSKNTVLITGGSAGIGLEVARQFAQRGNKVIVTGRSKGRLEAAIATIPGAIGIVGDISSEDDVNRLVENLKDNHPDLNIVVNNAGLAYLYDIAEDGHGFEKASAEMLTNYLSIVRLNERLLPLLKSQTESAIVNVSSIVAFVPGQLSTYSASKAALHSYTQSLRIALKGSSVKVFELMPPLVDTELSAAINGKTGIKPSVVAKELLESMAEDHFEIRVGNTQQIFELYRQSPEQALKAMNPKLEVVEALAL